MILVLLNSRRIVGPISLVLMLGLAATGAAAPPGPPVRIRGTLALTVPLAPTALLHKIAGAIYDEEMKRGRGLLGLPVEWLLDDQTTPAATRTLQPRLT